MTASAPKKLATRRLRFTDVLPWEGTQWLLTIGFCREGRVRELFLDGVKTGSSMDHWAHDSCILVSHLLQAGFTVAELLAKLPAPPAPESKTAPSLIAAMLAKALEVKHRDAAVARMAYEHASRVYTWATPP